MVAGTELARAPANSSTKMPSGLGGDWPWSRKSRLLHGGGESAMDGCSACGACYSTPGKPTRERKSVTRPQGTCRHPRPRDTASRAGTGQMTRSLGVTDAIAWMRAKLTRGGKNKMTWRKQCR
ncbi:unnamed protein product [Rangifer tarandus platyrhynchus]|uniref:Uncharacterized protein n=2 Tax=Rangifer tarandus platyrhynchus TaxID=3082113 RepID=A0ACB0FGJ0_RANTA|nr:unnamed protein product [Rangifer tarandus platyrhynchus]CAI9712110.1 unnamed protein product [Rangifer tarandus platyrhynchus]